MSDHASLFISLLAAQSGITAQVSTRIYGEVLFPDTDPGLKPDKAIVVNELESRAPMGGVPFMDFIFDVLCFGGSPLDSRVVAESVRAAFHPEQYQVTAGGYTWNMVAVQGFGPSQQDEKTGWDFFPVKIEAHGPAT